MNPNRRALTVRADLRLLAAIFLPLLAIGALLGCTWGVLTYRENR